MNSKFYSLIFTFVLLVVSTNAGRLQYVFHTDENFDPSIASSQAVHMVKRSANPSSGPCPSFFRMSCGSQTIRAICKGFEVKMPCSNVHNARVKL